MFKIGKAFNEAITIEVALDALFQGRDSTFKVCFMAELERLAIIKGEHYSPAWFGISQAPKLPSPKTKAGMEVIRSKNAAEYQAAILLNSCKNLIEVPPHSELFKRVAEIEFSRVGDLMATINLRWQCDHIKSPAKELYSIEQCHEAYKAITEMEIRGLENLIIWQNSLAGRFPKIALLRDEEIEAAKKAVVKARKSNDKEAEKLANKRLHSLRECTFKTDDLLVHNAPSNEIAKAFSDLGFEKAAKYILELVKLV